MNWQPIEWSEEQNSNELVSYNHVIGTCPFGEFIITWKGWKEHPSYSIAAPWEEYIDCQYSLDKAINVCQNEFFEKLDQCALK